MIELRILYIILAAAVGVVTVLLCFLLFHLVKIIKKARETTERLSTKAKALEEAFVKLTNLIQSITKIGEGFKEKGIKFTETISGLVGVVGAVKKIVKQFKSKKEKNQKVEEE